MRLVIVSGAQPLGFSITSAIKSAASTAYHVAQDPRAQALVAAAGQEYAPDTTASVMRTTHQIQSQIRAARRFVNDQGRTVVVQPGQTPPSGFVPADAAGNDAPAPGGDVPLQSHHGLLLVGGAVGAVLLVLLLTK